jgi:hypothetical protein
VITDIRKNVILFDSFPADDKENIAKALFCPNAFRYLKEPYFVIEGSQSSLTGPSVV